MAFGWDFHFSRTALTYHVGLDGAVGGGVGDAGEGEAGAHLVVVEEGLVGLVDGTRGDLARAGRARARAARVGEVDAGLLLVSGDSGSGGRGQRGSSSSAATIDAFSRRLSIWRKQGFEPAIWESRPIRGLREARVRSDAITRAFDRRASRCGRGVLRPAKLVPRRRRARRCRRRTRSPGCPRGSRG